MQLKTLFSCASFVAAAVAQISQSRIAFTVLPTNVQAGQPVNLQWGGGDGSPVTITLQQGPTTNLKTVAVLTGDATGNSYTWTPSSSLPNGQDYALKIEQGDTPPNYTGMITLTGGSTSSSSASSSGSASVSSTASVASSTAVSSPSSGNVTSPSTNSTSPVVSSNSTTTAAPVGTGVVGTGVGASGSAATGTSAARNTTLSKATLTSSSSTSSTAAATTTSGSGTTTSGNQAPSSSSKSGAVVNVASNFALLAAAVVGVVYLG